MKSLFSYFHSNQGHIPQFPKSKTTVKIGNHDVKSFSQAEFDTFFAKSQKHLGRGSYGEVRKMKLKESHQTVAIKLVPLKMKDSTPDQIFLEYANYVQITQRVSSQYFVPVFDVAIVYNGQTKTLAIMQEYFKAGNLDKIAKTPSRILLWAWQIFSALNVIHKFPFYHRDISAQNILIDNKGNARIGDLGISCFKGACAGQTTQRSPQTCYIDVGDAASTFMSVIDTIKGWESNPILANLYSLLENITRITECRIFKEYGLVYFETGYEKYSYLLQRGYVTSPPKFPADCGRFTTADVANKIKLLMKEKVEESHYKHKWFQHVQGKLF